MTLASDERQGRKNVKRKGRFEATGQSQSFAGKAPDETSGSSYGAAMAPTGDDIIATMVERTLSGNTKESMVFGCP